MHFESQTLFYWSAFPPFFWFSQVWFVLHHLLGAGGAGLGDLHTQLVSQVQLGTPVLVQVLDQRVLHVP